MAMITNVLDYAGRKLLAQFAIPNRRPPLPCPEHRRPPLPIPANSGTPSRRMAESLEARFKKAEWLIRNGPPAGTDNSTKLLFYSYYKQVRVQLFTLLDLCPSSP